MNVELVRVAETCRFHPALPGTRCQWEAWDAQDKFFLLTYMNGIGTAHALKDNGSWGQDDDDYDLVARFESDHPDEPELPLDEFCRRAGIQLAASAFIVNLEQPQ
jgi:U3 small nucleolar ribonucleoprotein component